MSRPNGVQTPAWQVAAVSEPAARQNMLDTLAWLGILFFLKSGLETSLVAAVRRGEQPAIEREQTSGA